MVYCSSTLSLAALEFLVHVDPEDAPADLVALELSLPTSTALATQPVTALPATWRDPLPPPACQQAGDGWIYNGDSLGLIVPSVIIPGEENLLLNPAHEDMHLIRVLSTEAFSFDPRLLYRG